jgi:signal transduction histidine kinase
MSITATRLAGQVTASMARISELVSTVQNYSQMDRAPADEIDIHEGLESTLEVLRQKLAGVQLVKSYDHALPKIWARAGELNQVWTYLVDNAADAMNGKGRLEIRTYSEDRWLVVEVCDDGPGIPPEIQPRVFEPFFTTKPHSAGMGLGLHICRQIVSERHKGEIRLHSRPGETCLQVFLPAQVPRREN